VILPVGTRVRLLAPIVQLTGRDTGIVVAHDHWDGYVHVRLDDPCVFQGQTLETIRESEDNLEVLA
jgi:hypothetical protein